MKKKAKISEAKESGIPLLRGGAKRRGGCILAFFVSVALTPFIVHADGNGFVPLATTETGSKLANLYSSGNISDYVSNLFVFMLSVGAILAVIKIMWAGYLYMASDSWGNMAKAKETMANVAIGILLLLGSYLILYQINPDIINMNAFKAQISQ